MTDQLTDKVEKYLTLMNVTLDWQFGLVFQYASNKAGVELNRLDVIEDERYKFYRVKYDSLIRRAKDTGLI
jgi:hypothetical protein